MIQRPTNHVCSDKDLPPESVETCSITARFMQKSFKTIEVCMSLKKAVILLFLPISIAFGQNLTQREIDDLVQKAEQGDIKAQRSIGFIHYEGNGLPKDAEKSIYWTKKSAEAGYGPAQINLGYFYSIGFGIPKDIKQTLFWYEQASNQGMPLANYNLGSMYALGEDVPKDLEKAASYYQKAADKGDVPSMVTLGGMYANGQGVKKDGYESTRYFQKAAEQGDIQSHLDLGKIYAYGLGVSRNFGEARKWLTKAVDLGSTEAKIALQELPKIEAQAKADERKRSLSFIQNLKEKYSRRLKYETAFARTTIQSFNLDCRTRDGRFLPLENVLLARLASVDQPHAWIVTRADSRGEDVRIYDDLIRKDGQLIKTSLVFELNKWGEIRSRGFSMDAVLNSCFDTYGPIAIVPNR